MTTGRGPLSFVSMTAGFTAVPMPPSEAAAYRGASSWCADHSAKVS
jgi:hypothetical protein